MDEEEKVRVEPELFSGRSLYAMICLQEFVEDPRPFPTDLPLERAPFFL
jgi:hypothetical protein